MATADFKSASKHGTHYSLVPGCPTWSQLWAAQIGSKSNKCLHVISKQSDLPRICK